MRSEQDIIVSLGKDLDLSGEWSTVFKDASCFFLLEKEDTERTSLGGSPFSDLPHQRTLTNFFCTNTIKDILIV